MRKLILLAILAIPVAIAVTLPARMAAHFLDLPPQLDRFSGTIWNGQALWRQPQQTPVTVQWRWRPPARWQWQASGGATELEGTLSGLVGSPVLEAVTGQVETQRLDLGYWLPGTRALGRLDVDLNTIRLAAAPAGGVSGRIIWEQAELVGSINAGLGRVRVVFEPESDLIARFESVEAADIQLSGHFSRAGAEYRLDAWLEAAAHRPDLRQPLARVGAADADGRVHVRYQGPLGW